MGDLQQVGEPLAEAFANDPVSTSLTELIHGLEPGTKLPSERALAEQLRISRTALRDRLATLEGLGVIRRHGGSGTYVDTLQPSSVGLALSLGISSSHLSLDALESVRVALERQAAREACVDADPVLVAYMRRAIDTLGRTDARDEVMAADRAFHQSLLRASRNPALEFFADALSIVLMRNLDVRRQRLNEATSGSPTIELLVTCHERIYDAIVAGAQTEAMAAVDAHFDALEPVHVNSATRD